MNIGFLRKAFDGFPFFLRWLLKGYGIGPKLVYYTDTIPEFSKCLLNG